jgi:predicted ABC-type ATPase
VAPAPRVIVIAGPNGAGKTTYAEEVLGTLGIDTFVNADYIARGLSGRDTRSVAFEAGRIMLGRLRQLADERRDFGFESTLSSRSFAPFLRSLKGDGWRIAIYYFSLRSAALAERRVKLRVRLGGHDVPAPVVQRRFGRSLANFFALYLPLADEWTLFDNSEHGESRPVATHNRPNGIDPRGAQTWQRLHRLAASQRNPR